MKRNNGSQHASIDKDNISQYSIHTLNFMIKIKVTKRKKNVK